MDEDDVASVNAKGAVEAGQPRLVSGPNRRMAMSHATRSELKPESIPITNSIFTSNTSFRIRKQIPLDEALCNSLKKQNNSRVKNPEPISALTFPPANPRRILTGAENLEHGQFKLGEF
ncbi:MAG TPA: hypothetical protein VFO41_08370 [Alphaproteobacteria bacterium]|nr:hypothetical protein [Alphaproteobacteria bacterium]